MPQTLVRTVPGTLARTPSIERPRTAVHAPTSLPTVRPRTAVRHRSAPSLHRLIAPVVIAAIAAPIALLVLVTGSFRPMVVSAADMSPAVQPGDMIVNELVRPGEIEVGDVISYSDEMRGGTVITQRVVNVEADGDGYALTLIGDSSAAGDQWSIDRDERVGRMAMRLPGFGSAVRSVTSGPTGAMLLTAVIALLVALVLPPSMRPTVARLRRRQN